MARLVQANRNAPVTQITTSLNTQFYPVLKLLGVPNNLVGE